MSMQHVREGAWCDRCVHHAVACHGSAAGGWALSCSRLHACAASPSAVVTCLAAESGRGQQCPRRLAVQVANACQTADGSYLRSLPCRTCSTWGRSWPQAWSSAGSWPASTPSMTRCRPEHCCSTFLLQLPHGWMHAQSAGGAAVHLPETSPQASRDLCDPAPPVWCLTCPCCDFGCCASQAIAASWKAGASAEHHQASVQIPSAPLSAVHSRVDHRGQKGCVPSLPGEGGPASTVLGPALGNSESQLVGLPLCTFWMCTLCAASLLHASAWRSSSDLVPGESCSPRLSGGRHMGM